MQTVRQESGQEVPTETKMHQQISCAGGCPRCCNAYDTLLAACEYAADMLSQMVPDGGKEVTLAERLAGMGGVRADKLLVDAIAKAKGGVS